MNIQHKILILFLNIIIKESRLPVPNTGPECNYLKQIFNIFITTSFLGFKFI